MMALKKYLRNPVRYEATSLTDFIKNVKAENVKSINVILDYISDEKRNSKKSHEEITKTHIAYEAILTYRRKITLNKYYHNMSQLEAIAYTGHKVGVLRREIQNIPITIMNTNKENIEKMYEHLLKLANKTISPK